MESYSRAAPGNYFDFENTSFTTYGLFISNVSYNVSQNDSMSSATEVDSYSGSIMGRLGWFLLFGPILGGLAAIGVATNTYIFIRFRYERRSNATNVVLAGLAFTDALLLAAFIIYYTVYRVTGFIDKHSYYIQVIDPYVAYVAFPVMEMALLCNTWVTVAAGAVRYVAVCWPLHAARLVAPERVKFALIAISVLSLLYQVHHFFARNPQNLAVTTFGSNEVYQLMHYKILRPTLYAVLPLLILVTLTTCLLRSLHRTTRERASLTRSGSAAQGEAQARQITRVLATILIVFTLCKLPFVVHAFTYRNDTIPAVMKEYTWVISDTFTVVNSNANFLIYVLLNSAYRKLLVPRAWHQNGACCKGLGCCPKRDDTISMQTRTSLLSPQQSSASGVGERQGEILSSI